MWPQAKGQKEQQVLDLVLKSTPSGNPQAILDAIDNYAWTSGFLMNIGDRKGAIMDEALHRYQPKVCILHVSILNALIPTAPSCHVYMTILESPYISLFAISMCS